MIFKRLFNKLLGEPKSVSIFKTDISHIRNDPSFNKSLEQILHYAETRKMIAPEQTGRAISTSFDPKLIYQLKNIEMVHDWLGDIIQKYIKYNNIKNFKEAYLIRGWCHKVYKGSIIKPHTHNDKEIKFVVVMYYDVPKNSSNLFIIDDKEKKDSYLDYDKKKVKEIKVEEGLAICFPPLTMHATNEHMSDLPRIIFTFDVGLK
jgi:hypothetical protein